MVIMTSNSKKKRTQVSFSNDLDESDADEEATIISSNRDAIPKRFVIDDPSSLRTLDIPSFALPLNEDRYELWTIRMPSAVNFSDIHNMSFHLANDDSQTILPQNTFALKDGSKYAFQSGHPVENESFRLLLPTSTSDDDEKLMVTSRSTFQKHFNVVLVPATNDESAAPSTALEHSHRRRAYAPVPQKTGLKRRWLPFGAALPDELDHATVTLALPTAAVPVTSEGVKMKEEYNDMNGHAAMAPPDEISSHAFRIKEEVLPEEAHPQEMDRLSKKGKKAQKKALKKERKHKRIKEEE
jgi:DNA-directed RNA polymerase I subunit RPA34.5